MRQVLFNSLPTHAPEKLRPTAFFISALARVALLAGTAELRSAWTGEGAVPTPGGSL